MDRDVKLEDRVQEIRRRPLIKMAAVWVVATLVLTLLGPFSTFTSLSVGARKLYWAVTIGSAILLVIGIRRIANMTRLFRARPVVYDTGIGLAFVALYLPILSAINQLFATGPLALSSWQIAMIVAGIAATQILLRAILGLRSNQPALAERPLNAQYDPLLPDTGLTQLQARIPRELRGDILSISSANHHVSVQTDKGKALVLVRFSDALKETADMPGQQIHRSHWVAQGAVEGLAQREGKLVAVLRTGAALPVSKTFEATATERWPPVQTK